MNHISNATEKLLIETLMEEIYFLVTDKDEFEDRDSSKWRIKWEPSDP